MDIAGRGRIGMVADYTKRPLTFHIAARFGTGKGLELSSELITTVAPWYLCPQITKSGSRQTQHLDAA